MLLSNVKINKILLQKHYIYDNKDKIFKLLDKKKEIQK